MGDKNTPDCATQGGGDVVWTENFNVLAMNSEAGVLTMATASPLWGSGQRMEFKQKFTRAGQLWSSHSALSNVYF